MNLINTILILIIIIFFINYFSNGQIFNTLKRIFSNCKQNIESFTNKQSGCLPTNNKLIPYNSQADFPYINKNNINNLDDETYGLYEFINYIVTKNVNIYELTPSYGQRTKVPKNIENNIISILSNIFNCNGYHFSNIKLNENIYYYENYRGKEFEPFIFTTDIMHNNKNLGNITLVIDCFLRYDKKNELLSITSLKIIKRNKFTQQNNQVISYNNQAIIQQNNQAILQHNNQAIIHNNQGIPQNNQAIIQNNQGIPQNNQDIPKMNDMINDIRIPSDNNDLFIKQKKQVSFESNDTDNSLIPSIDDISI